MLDVYSILKNFKILNGLRNLITDGAIIQQPRAQKKHTQLPWWHVVVPNDEAKSERP